MRELSERGFTVGELLLVASLLTFATTGVTKFVSHLRQGKPGRPDPNEELYRELVGKGRGAVDQMVQELSLAGYPASASLPSQDDLSSGNSNQVAARTLLVASESQVIFEADLDHDGAVERVEYRLNGMALERSAVSKHSDGTVPEAHYEALIENVDNGAMPLFTYLGDPFSVAPSGDNAPGVRILLLLRLPAVNRKKQQPYRTVGFEGIARRHYAVAEQPDPPAQQSEMENEPAEPGSAFQPSQSITDQPVFNQPVIDQPIQETFARKWTMR